MSVTQTPYSTIHKRGLRTAILHLCADLEPDDPARETVNLAVLTQRSGWRALIASAGGRLVTEAERAAVRHFRMPLDGRGLFSDWRNRLHLEALIQKEKPAIIHSHGAETLALATSLAKTHRIPLVVDITQPLPHMPRLPKTLAMLKDIQGYIRAPSEFMVQHLRDQIQCNADKIRLVPPGIDLQWHSAGFISPERLQNLNRLWRLPENASIILVPMPLLDGMGQELFLQAMCELKNEAVYAVLLGSDRQQPGLSGSLEKQIEHMGLSGKIVMPEFCTDLPAACWLASVIVAPNKTPRGQILELLAAQAIGRPVIVTDTGASNEMVIRGETAWVVPAENKAALVTALREAIHLNTNQRLNMAGTTHDFVAQTFPLSGWFDGMMELYETMLRPAERSARSQAA